MAKRMREHREGRVALDDCAECVVRVGGALLLVRLAEAEPLILKRVHQLVHEHQASLLGLLRSERTGQAGHDVFADDQAPGVGVVVTDDLLAEDAGEHAPQVLLGVQQAERAVDEPRPLDLRFFDLRTQAVCDGVAVFDFDVTGAGA